MFNFSRFPYTSFNQVNLDWMMRKIKQLEPAIDVIDDVQEAVTEAQSAAAAATAAVETVTSQAAEALEIAAEAKEIAQDAAEATIVDGSITEDKLSSDVKASIQTATNTASIANTNATSALSAATNAGTAAATALNAAQAAQASASAALAAADGATLTAETASATAESAATIAQNAANKFVWYYLGDQSAAGVTFNPNAYNELLFVLTDSTYSTSCIMPVAALPSSAGGVMVLGGVLQGGVYASVDLTYNTDGTITATKHNTATSFRVYARTV